MAGLRVCVLVPETKAAQPWAFAAMTDPRPGKLKTVPVLSLLKGPRA